MKPDEFPGSEPPNAIPPAYTPHPWAAVACLALAVIGVLATARFRYSPPANDAPWFPGVCPTAKALAGHQLRVWADPARRDAGVTQLRQSNPEWDFMGRTFLVMALGEIGLRDPATAAENLRTVDQIVRSTLRLEARDGPFVFLMSYARHGPYLTQPVHSLFVDGEITLMLGVRARLARAATATDPDTLRAYRDELAVRSTALARGLAEAPDGFVESYPNECWLFDHAFAFAALRLADRELGTDHRELARVWLERARTTLREPTTGLLHSSFTRTGRALEGPEGSTLWLTAHLLEAIDPPFARGLYQDTREYLARRLWGFAWSREWPVQLRTGADIDSGVVVPLVDASPSGSGFALVAAAGFGDAPFLRELQTSVGLAAFPIRDGGALHFAASNGVGDAVLLYALTVGPLWREICESDPNRIPQTTDIR